MNLPNPRAARAGAALGALLALPLLGGTASATIWGLKTHDPVSGPPAMLFWYNEQSGSVGQVAPLTVGGLQVDADGLAQDREGRLFAWKLDGSSSTLLQVDPLNAVGSPVGPALEGVQIRGAAFTLAGRLWAYDNTSSKLLEIDPANGQALGVGVQVDGLEPGGAFLTGDLAQDVDGSLLFAMGGLVARLNPWTGQLTQLYNDFVNLGDGYSPWSVGLALAGDPPLEGALHLLDVSLNDGFYRYASSSDFTRTLLVDHVVPSYNAGRGDLASLPAGRAEIVDLRVSEGLAELDAWCRAGIWVWVEYSAEWAEAVWSEVPGSLRQVPAGGSGIATFSQWEGLPAPGEQGFWRLRSSMTEPE